MTWIDLNFTETCVCQHAMFAEMSVRLHHPARVKEMGRGDKRETSSLKLQNSCACFCLTLVLLL